MRTVEIPKTLPDEVWFWFTPSEWNALPVAVRRRIVLETRLGGHGAWIGTANALAIFTATQTNLLRPFIDYACS